LSDLTTKVAIGQAQIDSAFKSISAKFGAVHELQLALFGEFSDLNSLLFTSLLALMVWWLTAIRRLKAARLHSLLLCFGFMMLERMLQPSWRHFFRTVLVMLIAFWLLGPSLAEIRGP
jgi:hypothetical protein